MLHVKEHCAETTTTWTLTDTKAKQNESDFPEGAATFQIKQVGTYEVV